MRRPYMSTSTRVGIAGKPRREQAPALLHTRGYFGQAQGH